MSDIERYAYWMAEIDAQASGFKPSIDQPRTSTDMPDEPLDGFWRIMAAKTKPDAPVAIWTEGENGSAVIWVKIGRRNKFDMNGTSDEAGSFTSGYSKLAAVSEEEYKTALDTGIWPSDRKYSRSMSIEEQLGIPPLSDMTRSNEEQVPAYEILQQVVEAAIEKAKLLPIETKEQADMAMALVDRLAGLYTYTSEKASAAILPFKEAFDTEKGHWSWVDSADDTRKALKRRVQDWLAEEQRKADAKAAAETAARQAAAVKQAEDLGMDTSEVEVAPVVAEKVTAGANHGRSVSATGTKWVGEVVDEAAYVAHLLTIKDGELVALLKKKADAIARTVKSFSPAPGVKGKLVSK
jgi:hypothetical protein